MYFRIRKNTLDVLPNSAYILPMATASPLTVTRTPAGWAITHRPTGLVVLASDVLKTRVMARTAARLLTAGMNWTAPSASAIAALPTLRNAVIRTVSARRREQLARVHTVPTPVLGQVAA